MFLDTSLQRVRFPLPTSMSCTQCEVYVKILSQLTTLVHGVENFVAILSARRTNLRAYRLPLRNKVIRTIYSNHYIKCHNQHW